MKSNFFIFLHFVLFQFSGAIISFNDEIFFDHTADRYDWTKHPCRRTCIAGIPPQTCKYVFVIEQFLAMSKACYNCPVNVTDCYRPHCIPADGVTKPVYVVNRQLPGPPIEVCKNDIILVEVRNRLLAEGTTIHWHGFKQHYTPYMDGVPYVTQCPILPGQNFQYLFKATIAGTFFYHSHAGNQRADGLYGSLVVKKFMQNEHMAGLYDDDSLRMIVGDWSHETGNVVYASQFYDKIGSPQNILVNGLGRFKKFTTDDGRVVQSPVAIFEVTKGVRYRIRVIDAGYDDCPIKISIDGHTILVIAMDSNDIEPVEVDAITIWPGERIDIVIKADQPIDNYWISYSGYSLCKNNDTGVHQVAILRYAGAEPVEPKNSVGYTLPFVDGQRVLNPFNLGTEKKTSRNVDIPDINSMAGNDISLREHPDHQIYISFNFRSIDNYDDHRRNLYGYYQVAPIHRYGTLQFNHISLKFPPVPLLSQWDMLGPDPYCNATHHPQYEDCEIEQCACTHVIKLRHNSVVELVFVAEGPGQHPVAVHPLHLHGHFYRVVAMKRLGDNVTTEQVKQLDREGKIKRRLDRAPYKDSIKAPSGGYTVVRLLADNPGYWFFHCHIELHNNIGMALIFQVGEHEEFPPPPKNFPRCQNFIQEKL